MLKGDVKIEKIELKGRDYKFVKMLPFYISSKIILEERRICDTKRDMAHEMWVILKYRIGKYKNIEDFCRKLEHFVKLSNEDIVRLVDGGYEKIVPVALRISEYFITKMKQSPGEYGVDDIKTDLEEKFEMYIKVDSKDTLFHQATRFSDHEMVECFINKVKICEPGSRYLRKNVSVTFTYCDSIDLDRKWNCKTVLAHKGLIAKNSCGDTPLHLAVKFSDYDMVKLLIEGFSVADLSVLNDEKKTAFDIAMDLRRYDVAKLLIDRGIYFEASDRYFENIVYDVIKARDLSLLQSILQRGVNVSDTMLYNADLEFGRLKFKLRKNKKDLKVIENRILDLKNEQNEIIDKVIYNYDDTYSYDICSLYDRLKRISEEIQKKTEKLEILRSKLEGYEKKFRSERKLLKKIINTLFIYKEKNKKENINVNIDLCENKQLRQESMKRGILMQHNMC